MVAVELGHEGPPLDFHVLSQATRSSQMAEAQEGQFPFVFGLLKPHSYPGKLFMTSTGESNGMIELMVFFFLCAVTYFRKQLSTNNCYMDPDEIEDLREYLQVPTSTKQAIAHTRKGMQLTTKIIQDTNAAATNAANVAATAINNTTRHTTSVASVVWTNVPSLREFKSARHSTGGISVEARQRALSGELMPTLGPFKYDVVSDLTLGCLPVETVLLTFDFLDLASLFSVAAVDQALNSLCDSTDTAFNECAWKSQWLRRFGAHWESRSARHRCAGRRTKF
mmetsp:Transcript_45959/g.127717  ORF Transcript_45959/g.127717 Transcript_45959/m.127717 type:complete len:281 (+) Transcript_45959:548-1390(+)